MTINMNTTTFHDLHASSKIKKYWWYQQNSSLRNSAAKIYVEDERKHMHRHCNNKAIQQTALVASMRFPNSDSRSSVPSARRCCSGYTEALSLQNQHLQGLNPTPSGKTLSTRRNALAPGGLPLHAKSIARRQAAARSCEDSSWQGAT